MYVGDCVALPNEPTLLLTVAKVKAFVLFAVPSKVLPALVASPVVVPIVLAVCKAVAVPALPVILAVTLLLKVFAPAIVCVPVVITPLFAALASGKLNVCVLPVELIAKSVPEVPVAKFCTCACKPFNAVNPVVKVVITSHKCPFCVCSVIVLLE